MTEYSVDGWNNFCRVFELPRDYPSDYCFGGGIPVQILMVDWFNPVPDIPQPGVSKETWKKEVGEIETTTVTHDELYKELVPWLLKKPYIRPGREYLVLCDFGVTLRFEGCENSDD